MAEKKKLYVGCSLTLAPQNFVNRVEALKERLSDSYEIMQFLGLVDGTADDVYRRDIIENVGGSDGVLGVCDEPSIGLGWELCRAVDLGKPTLGVVHVGSRITRLVLGAPAFEPNFSFERYEDMCRDVPELVRLKLFGVEPTVQPAT